MHVAGIERSVADAGGHRRPGGVAEGGSSPGLGVAVVPVRHDNGGESRCRRMKVVCSAVVVDLYDAGR